MKELMYWRLVGLTVLVGIVVTLLPTIAAAKIVFSSNRDNRPSIYVMDDDGSNVQRLTFSDNQGPWDQRPAWSPNGQRIAFERYRNHPVEHLDDLLIIDQKGGNVLHLTNDPVTLYGDVTWAPDGQSIAFVSFRLGGNANGREIYTMDLNTKDIQQLTHHPINGEQTFGPSWSPNGKYIAYEQSFRPWRITNIYVMHSNGEDPHPLAPHKDWDQYSPHWSHDSKSVLFAERLSEFIQPQIRHLLCRVVIQKHGSNERQILKTPENWNIHSVCWMDNGRQVLIGANESLNGNLPHDIYKYNLSNENITNITNNPASDFTPHWISDSIYSVTPRKKKMINWGMLKK